MLEVRFVQNNAWSNQQDAHLRKVRQTVKTLADTSDFRLRYVKRFIYKAIVIAISINWLTLYMVMRCKILHFDVNNRQYYS